MLSNSQPFKYVPEANALSQPHSIKPARLETRFSGHCSGNRLLIGLTGAAARCRSQKRLGSPCKGFVLELFMDQPELFFNQPELLNQPELFINWPGLFINWAELACKLARPHADPEFLNLPGPDVFILINSACRVFKFKMCTSWAWSGFAKLSFCCITMTGTPYGTNAQLPGP